MAITTKFCSKTFVRDPCNCFSSSSSSFTYSNNSSSWMRNIKITGDRLKEKKSLSLTLVVMTRAKLSGPEKAVRLLIPFISYTNNNNEAVDLISIWVNVVDSVVSLTRLAQSMKPTQLQAQMHIERVLIDCRFFTLLAVVGSLLGSVLCFVEGCFMVLKSYFQYFHGLAQGLGPGHVVQLLIEAIDMFLVGSAMLIFGMGLYAIFVGPESTERSRPQPQLPQSNLFGLFHLKMMPSWIERQSVSQAKSRIGHALMIILQVGVVEKFKSIPLVTAFDLACFAAALLVSSACIFLLSKLSTN